MRLVARIVVVPVFAAAMLFVATASAKDSHAPKDARDRWLPCESWVMFHWIPYDQERLWAITGIRQLEFRHFIADDDKHSLALLIKQHGKDPNAVARQLMEPWRGKVSDAKFAELTRRTNELMTQGHLAQHVFFHYFHDPILAIDSNWIFRTPPGDYHRARLRGYGPSEIAVRAGVPVKVAVRRALSVMRRIQDEAVRTGQTPRGQADSFVRQQSRWITFWLTQRLYAHRRGPYPAGNPPAKGDRLRQACTYMSGARHVAGPHDDSQPGPFEHRITAHESTRPALGSLYCNLMRHGGRVAVDPAVVAELQDYIRKRGIPIDKSKPLSRR